MIALIINLTTAVVFGLSLYYDRNKSIKAVKIALRKALGLAPLILIIITAIGFIFAFLPPALIREYLGGEFNIIQVAASGIFGSIMMIPSLIALPLAASLVEAGASYTPVAAFITTLTMVGFVTIPVELKELGKKITIYRNILAFIFAVIISFIIGGLM